MKKVYEYRIFLWNKKTQKYCTLPPHLKSADTCLTYLYNHEKSVVVYHPEYDYSKVVIERRLVEYHNWEWCYGIQD